jgi:nitroreductase
MEFSDVLRHRRMVRHYLDQPVDPATVERVVAAGLRAPSAGFSQGYALLVLDQPRDRERFWAATEVPQETASWPAETKAGVLRAPVLIVALSCKRAYLDRYAREDKGWTDHDEARWPVSTCQ